MLAQERHLSFVDRAEFDRQVDRHLLAFSFPLEHAMLRESIARCGLAQPLLVCRNVLVCGHRRLFALTKHPEITKIPVLSLSGLTLPEAFELALAENTATRTLNLLERARAIACLSRLQVSENEMAQTWLPRLGSKPSNVLQAQYRDLLRLNEDWQIWVAQENPHLKTALLLAGLDRDTQASLFSITSQFHFGINRLDEILQNLKMIAKRETRSIQAILEEIPLQNAEAIRSLIHRRAFPTLTGMEEKFALASKNLALPSSIDLRPPQHFEGDRLDIHFQFGSPDELKKAAQKLLDSAEKSDLKDLLELL